MAKKFISFLGTSTYTETTYIHNTPNMGSYTSKFIQEALVHTVCKDWHKSDKALTFITEDANKINWYNEKDQTKRLKTLLEKSHIESEGIQIPTGENEEEIWKIFDIVINNIEDGDEVVLDITHAWIGYTK